MKKKFGLCLTILTTLSLTSCINIFDYSFGGRSNRSYSKSNLQILSSIPDVDEELTPKTGTYNMMDYIEHNVYALSGTPTVGEAHILVIPVWFSNSTSFISTNRRDNIREDIETAYFGTNEETGWRSVKTFYEEESQGALTITGTVSDWYETGSSFFDYAIDDSVEKTMSLVNDATDWYFTNNPSDKRTNYDKDKDGYLDGVMFIYAAPDYTSMSREEYTNLWAYCFWIQDSKAKNVNKPGANAFFWASYDFMYDKNTSYQRTFTSRYGKGDTSHCNVDAHSYIHEMGHMFGLDDYYDYSNYEYDPAGGFSMQDHNVGGHDPFSMYVLGWGKAYTPNETTTINLKPLNESGEMILLSPNNNGGAVSPFDEYLLLEYYTPTGVNELDSTYSYCDKGPDGTKDKGIRLWHADGRLIYYSDFDEYETHFTNNPTERGGTVTFAMTNTYQDNDPEHQGYLSPAGERFYNYNVLQMIRNNPFATYKPKKGDGMVGENLFKAGESFKMSDFPNQFVNSGKLNDNTDLGYAFQVNELTDEFASITVIKL